MLTRQAGKLQPEAIPSHLLGRWPLPFRLCTFLELSNHDRQQLRTRFGSEQLRRADIDHRLPELGNQPGETR